MTSTRYIEVTSVNRNRNIYPCPGEFVIPAYCTTGNSQTQIRDKVLASYPEFAWYMVPTTTLLINGRRLEGAWPLRRDERKTPLDDIIAQPVRFAGGTKDAPILGGNFTAPENIWVATHPLSINLSYNSLWSPENNYFVGAQIYVFSGDKKMAPLLPDLSKGDWKGPVQISTITSYEPSTGEITLSSTLGPTFSPRDDWFIINFITDPSGKYGDSKIFLPNPPDATVGSYKGAWIIPFEWDEDCKDSAEDPSSGMMPAKISYYDLSSSTAYLDRPLFDPKSKGATYTLRIERPISTTRYLGIGLGQSSVADINILSRGAGYIVGQILADADPFSIFSRPGKNTLERVDYLLRGSGKGLLLMIESVDVNGGILSLKILQQGRGYIQGRLILEQKLGVGYGTILEINGVYQSLEIPCRGRILGARKNDFVYLPLLNRWNSNGITVTPSRFGPPILPRYIQISKDALDIAPSGYPAQLTVCKDGKRGSRGFSGVRSIYKIAWKKRTTSGIWKDAGVNEVDNILVIFLEKALPIDIAAVRQNGRRMYIMDKDATGGILLGQHLELLPLSRENEAPLNYTGSTVSQQQMVCYQISLLSLVLPNLPLRTEIGGKIAFYPYVYVEFRNYTAPSSGSTGTIYSNNPNSLNALFRVNIDDINRPESSKFVKLTGDRTTQTVKFKPNDNLYFRVYLPDGKLFQTQRQDQAPPLVPDPFVQISACFSIRRVV